MADVGHCQTTSLSVPKTLDENNISLHMMTDVLQTFKGITSDEVTSMFEYVLDLWISSFLSYFGIGANILNLVVFNRMGFKDTINISLTFITSWDLLKCVCFAFIKMYGPIALVSAADAISWTNVTMISLGYMHTMAGYASGLLAGYVAVERCLCLSKPLTVKFLLTKKVVISVNATISFLTVGCYVCVYSMYKFINQFDPLLNRTIIVYSFETESPTLGAYIEILSMVLVILSFVVICVCTWIIFVQLKRATKFRSSLSSDGQKGSKSIELSARDRQVIQMLLIIIAVYIVCFMPRVGLYLTQQLLLEFKHGRLYQNTMWVYVYIITFFDLINASVNIFIYYSMSSQFKAAYRGLISFGKSV